MTGYIQLLVHLVGDFWLQSDWMAVNKTKQTIPCLVHVLIYTACFYVIGLLTTPLSLTALLVIGVTHFLIDRFALPKYLIYWKNRILKPPTVSVPSFKECSLTGFDPSRPDFIRVWLLIICDNTLHLVINAIAIAFL